MKFICQILLILVINTFTSCFKDVDTIPDSRQILDHIIEDFPKNLPYFNSEEDTLLVKFPDRVLLEKTGICDFRYFKDMGGYSNDLINNLYVGSIPQARKNWKKSYNLVISHVCFINDNYEINVTMSRIYGDYLNYVYTYDKNLREIISKEFKGVTVQ